MKKFIIGSVFTLATLFVSAGPAQADSVILPPTPTIVTAGH